MKKKRKEKGRAENHAMQAAATCLVLALFLFFLQSRREKKGKRRKKEAKGEKGGKARARSPQPAIAWFFRQRRSSEMQIESEREREKGKRWYAPIVTFVNSGSSALTGFLPLSRRRDTEDRKGKGKQLRKKKNSRDVQIATSAKTGTGKRKEGKKETVVPPTTFSFLYCVGRKGERGERGMEKKKKASQRLTCIQAHGCVCCRQWRRGGEEKGKVEREKRGGTDPTSRYWSSIVSLEGKKAGKRSLEKREGERERHTQPFRIHVHCLQDAGAVNRKAEMPRPCSLVPVMYSVCSGKGKKKKKTKEEKKGEKHRMPAGGGSVYPSCLLELDD